MILTYDETEQLYESLDPALEGERDACGKEFVNALVDAVESDGGEPHPEWKSIAAARQASSIIGGGKVLKSIAGMGTVYDWRDSDWTPFSGPFTRTTPLLGVQHIPVVRNVDGIADMVTLRNVLVAQNLMVQSCTDAEGNVGLFVPGNILCWQAKGANQVSWGTEHMHLSTGERWNLRQLRAAAWVNQLNHKHYGTASTRASLDPGDGLVRVVHGGQTTHMAVSNAAGFHDRSDPGPGYDFEYVAHCEQFFSRHGNFKGA